jgi:hypothetical protein
MLQNVIERAKIEKAPTVKTVEAFCSIWLGKKNNWLLNGHVILQGQSGLFFKV